MWAGSVLYQLFSESCSRFSSLVRKARLPKIYAYSSGNALDMSGDKRWKRDHCSLRDELRVCISYLAMKCDLNKQGFKKSYCPGCLPRGKNCPS